MQNISTETQDTTSLLSSVFESEKALPYTCDKWLISILNTTSQQSDFTFGHTALLIEGQLLIKGQRKNFYGYYHVGVRDLERHSRLSDLLYNPSGKLVVHKPIEEIGNPNSIIRKTKSILKDQVHNSYYARPEHALFLILSIHDDYHHYLIAEKGYQAHQRYQVSGIEGFFSWSPPAHNCVSWCVEKMKMAHINIHTGLVAYGKLLPQKITNRKMQDMLDTCDRFTQFLKSEKRRHQEKNRDLEQDATFWATKSQARTALLCQQYDTAIVLFKTLLIGNKKDLNIQHDLAVAHISAGQYEEGFDYLIALLHSHDPRGDAWYHPGFSMFIQEATGIDPLTNLYELCFKAMNYSEKIKDRLWAHYGLACLFLWQGNMEKAKEHIKNAKQCTIDNNLMILDTLWANLLIQEGHPLAAIAILDKHKEHNETPSFYFYRALAIASSNCGDMEQAKKNFLRAAQLNNFEKKSWNARVRYLHRNNLKQAHQLYCVLQACQAIEEDIPALFEKCNYPSPFANYSFFGQNNPQMSLIAMGYIYSNLDEESLTETSLVNKEWHMAYKSYKL